MLVPKGPGVFLHTMGGGPPSSLPPFSDRAPAWEEHASWSVLCVEDMQGCTSRRGPCLTLHAPKAVCTRVKDSKAETLHVLAW